MSSRSAPHSPQRNRAGHARPRPPCAPTAGRSGRVARANGARLLVLLAAVSCLGCSWWQRWSNPEPRSARHLLEQSRDAEAAGDLRQARALLEQAVRRDPDDAEVRRRLARLLADAGEIEAALPHAAAAAEGSSDEPEPWVRLAELQMARDDWSAAEKSLDRAVACDPRHVPALLARARLEQRRGRTEAAVAACHQALHADPDLTEGRLLLAQLHLESQRPRQAAPLLRTVIDCPGVSAERRSEALRLLGLAYGAEARWDDAAAALEEAARDRPLPADDWYRLAYAQYRAGRTDAAGASLARLAQVDPRHPAAAALAARIATGSPIRTVAADPRLAGAATDGHSVLPLGRTLATDDVPVPNGWAP
jgi:tetratricopeptide (TPR) repeat protein